MCIHYELHSTCRVYVLCDLHLYRLYDDYTMKKKAPIDIGDILGISLSNGADQAIVLHCAVSLLCTFQLHINTGCAYFSIHREQQTASYL